MPYVTLISPLVDIVLVSVVFNVAAYGAYAYIYKREFAKIASVDIRLSIAELLLVIANYAGSGAVIGLWGYEISWWLWYIIVSIPVEIIFFMAYKYYFGLSWEEIAGSGIEDKK